MALLNSEILPFKSTAFHKVKFVPFRDADLKCKCSAALLYPAECTFVCPTELGDLADNNAEFQKPRVDIYRAST